MILTGSLGGVEVTIERDNIASGLLEADGYFGTRGAQRQLGFCGVMPERARVVEGLSQRDSYGIARAIPRAHSRPRKPPRTSAATRP